MEHGKIVKQMLDFHKTTFDNTFNAMCLLQEQTEKMVNMFLEQSPWVPEEGRKLINEWIEAYKKGRTEFKAAVDESYKRVEAFFAGVVKESKAKGSQ